MQQLERMRKIYVVAWKNIKNSLNVEKIPKQNIQKKPMYVKQIHNNLLKGKLNLFVFLDAI